ncbi:MAG: hypothetical protein ACKVQS_11370 [Fimbriimonadaceae bacterium]
MENNESSQKPTIEDLHAGTTEIADAARHSLDKIDKDFNSKIDDLSTRVKSARKKADQFKPEANNTSGMTPTDARGMGVGLTVAYAIIGTPLFLYFVGFMIDKAVGTNPDAPLKWATGLLMVGAVIGVWFAIMTTQKLNK